MIKKMIPAFKQLTAFKCDNDNLVSMLPRELYCAIKTHTAL